MRDDEKCVWLFLVLWFLLRIVFSPISSRRRLVFRPRSSNLRLKRASIGAKFEMRRSVYKTVYKNRIIYIAVEKKSWSL